MIIERNGVYFGTTSLPNRKKWALMIGTETTAKVVAYFSNNNRRVEFEKAMLKFFYDANVHGGENDGTADKQGCVRDDRKEQNVGEVLPESVRQDDGE